MADKPNILIMGAGAIGAWFGGILAKSETANVTFVARGKHLDALQNNGGCTIITENDEFFVPVQTISDQDALPVSPDWIFITVKSMDTPAAIEAMKKWIGHQTQIITIQNGLENYELLKDAFGADRVVRGLCRIGVELTKPGIITYRGLGEIIYGEETGNTSDRIIHLENILSKAEIPHKISEQITHESWKKFLWNSVFNMLTGLTATTTDTIFNTPEALQLARELAREVQLAASVDGITISDETISKIFHSTEKLGAFRTSTFQDRMKGKALEYDTFCGYLVRKADEHKIQLPGYRHLYALYRMLDHSEI